MGPVQKISTMLPKLLDGTLLAIFHHVVQECLSRDTISVKYLSDYPKLVSKKGVERDRSRNGKRY